MPIKARFLLSTMKADDYAIYLDYVVLGQLIPVKILKIFTTMN